MGSSKATNEANIADKESKLADLNSELKLDLAQAALDVAGVADPTPISDGLSGIMSLARGDFIGAGLSLVSMVPYAGDALAKTAKGARLAKKMAGLKKKIEAATTAISKLKAQQMERLSKGTAKMRAKMKKDAAEKFQKSKTCKTCKAPANKYGTKTPDSGGQWKNGEKGNGEWHPDPNTPRGKKVLEETGGKPVKFKDGYPDFSPYAKDKVEIPMTGNREKDFALARDEMRRKTGDSNWPGRPGETTPKGYTWHHNENGTTMELVPTKLHENVTHSGGDSLANQLNKQPQY